MLFAALLPLYFTLKRRETGDHLQIMRQSQIVRGLCTLAVLILCLNGCIVNGFMGFWWLFAGLLFCFIGDIAEETNKRTDLIFFLVHGSLIAAFLYMSVPSALTFLPVLLVFLAAAILILRKKPKNAPLKTGRLDKIGLLVRFLTAIVLAATPALALLLPTAMGTVLMAAGALLLTVSDIIQLRNRTYEANPSLRKQVIRMVCYYASLYLIALSVWM